MFDRDAHRGLVSLVGWGFWTKGVLRTGGWGYSAAKADEVMDQSSPNCSVLVSYDARWYLDTTPIGVGGLYGGHASANLALGLTPNWLI